MLSDYALVTGDELKTALNLSGTGMDTVIEGIVNRVSDMVEAYLGRLIVTRTTATPATRITEYHSVDSFRSELFLTQFPVTTLTSVKEGSWSGAAWVPTTTLVEKTDYLVDKASGKLIRVSAGARGSWAIGLETVEVVYAAGYTDTAAVPQAIKDVALAVAGRKFQELNRGGQAQQITDGMGMTMRFLPSELLRMEKEALAPWRSWSYSSTGRVA